MIGHKAETIVRFAQSHQCQIVLENKADSSFAIFGLGSIASQVRRLMNAQASNAASSGVSSLT